MSERLTLFHDTRRYNLRRNSSARNIFRLLTALVSDSPYLLSPASELRAEFVFIRICH
jgi:hypothetical protein